MAATAPDGALRVWDLPVRVFHWALVVDVALAWWTAETDQMPLHRTLGFIAAGLVAFRIFWGFAGSSTARFSDFVRTPAAVAAYARKLPRDAEEAPPPGHNPMGGWSVVALLAALLAIVALGLYAVDTDGEVSGPLARFVSYDAGRLAARWHRQTFNVLLALLALHVAAIAFYHLLKGENLIGAMITGRRRGLSGEMRPARLPALAAGLALGVGVTLVLALMK